jgi:hypothetical protein
VSSGSSFDFDASHWLVGGKEFPTSASRCPEVFRAIEVAHGEFETAVGARDGNFFSD